MLVHICCSVDSHYFLQKLRQTLPDEPLVGYFYDPNIHPYSEYMLRYMDVRRSCDRLGVELILGEYDYNEWLAGTKGLENEPEKGKRCSYCFNFRVGNAAKIAQKLGHTSLTTTLLMSPKKDFNQLKAALDEAVSGTDIAAYAVDFRINGGTNEQFMLAKNDKLYHQNYCGCVFALSKQREAQKQPAIELSSEVYGRVLPGSIEARIALYERVKELEDSSLKFELRRRSFLNYRLWRALLRADGAVVPSYFVLYSHFKRANLKISISKDGIINGVADGLRDGVVFMGLDKFNSINNTSFKSVKSLCAKPLEFEVEMTFRHDLCGQMSINPIIVLDELAPARYEILAYDELFYDSHEVIEVL